MVIEHTHHNTPAANKYIVHHHGTSLHLTRQEARTLVQFLTEALRPVNLSALPTNTAQAALYRRYA
jgi:hypothetical protein